MGWRQVAGLLMPCGNWLAGAEQISALYASLARESQRAAKKRGSIDHQICSFLWKGCIQDRVPRGQKKMSSSQSNQGRAKVNKGDMEQEREET